jgi:SAM-dependent methyltransferase
MATFNWFENWFDSRYYHLLYQHRDHNEAEFFISNLVKFLQLKPKQRILDLACGKGRHSVFLNEMGLDVVGFDLSVNSISEAKKHENSTLHFHVHDMRHPFPLRFDCILSLFTSFGYFQTEKEDLQVLENIRNSLETHGILVLDFFNSEKVRKMQDYHETKHIDGIEFVIHKWVDHERNRIRKNIQVTDGDKKMEFHESVELISVKWLSEQLKELGFKVEHLLGDYSLHPYSLQSERMIIIATKK